MMMNVGKYHLSIDNHEIGYENFVSENTSIDNGIIRINACLDLVLKQKGDRVISTSLDTDLTYGPGMKYISYQAKGCLLNQDIHIEIEFGKNYAECKQGKVTVNTDSMVVLDNSLTSHYLLLLKRFQMSKTDKMDFTAFIPQVFTKIQGSIENKGKVVFEHNAGEIELDSYDVFIGSTMMSLLSLNEHVYACNIPSQKFSSSLSPYHFKEIKRKKSVESIPEEVVFEQYEIDETNTPLKVELSRPRKQKENQGVGIIFFSGSGKIDKDGKVGGVGGVGVDMQSQAIAYHLSKGGHYYLRYDDRGVGDNAQCDSENTFFEECQDGKKALRFMENLKSISAEKFFLIGHSSGGLTALKIASEVEEIGGVILLATPAQPLQKIIVDQTKRFLELDNILEEQKNIILEEQKKFFEFVEAYPKGGAVPEKYKMYSQSIEWLREVFHFDVRNTVRKVHSPILVLQGNQDFQVDPVNANLFANLLAEKKGGESQVKVFPGLDHFFMDSRDGNVARYFDSSRPFSPKVLETIDAWLMKFT